MSEVKIRKEINKAIHMLTACQNQKGVKPVRLLRIDGGIALAEMFLEKAKESIRKEMDRIEKLNSDQNVQVSDTTEADSKENAGIQK